MEKEASIENIMAMNPIGNNEHTVPTGMNQMMENDVLKTNKKVKNLSFFLAQL